MLLNVFLIATGSISQQGVKNKVIADAKERPQTTAKDIGCHHSETLPPISISL
jgi:hypothetical protein